MVKINWTFKDINEIAEHIAQYSQKYASQIVDDFFQKRRSAFQFPTNG